MKRPKFHDPDDPMWVVGSIDSYGAIHARVAKSGGSVMHTKAESNGKRWRWNIWGQEFHATRAPTLDKLSDEEWTTVEDWLLRKGLKYED